MFDLILFKQNQYKLQIQHLLENKELEQLTQQIQQFVPIQKYLATLDTQLYDIQQITINSIDYFGQRIGFLKLIVQATNKINNKRIPGIVQLRGGSVGILIEVLNTTTNELKMATGTNLLEIPAGMLDNNGDIAGVAIKEIEEETGIKITKDKLTYLGQAYSSPGLLDEIISYFYFKIEYNQEQINKIEKQIYGEKNSSETIKLVFYDQNCKNQLLDGKFYTALGLKHQLQ